MDITQIVCSCLCFILFLTSDVSSFVLTPSSTTSPALLGNHPYSLYCQYTLIGNEEFQGMKLSRKQETETTFSKIVTFQVPGSPFNATYAVPVLDMLESRTKLTNPTTSAQIAMIEFSEVACSDKATYRWDAQYSTGNAFNVIKDVTLDIKAKATFETDGILTYQSNVQYKAGDEITFTCIGGVGSTPVGWMSWYYYLSTSAAGTNVSSSAVDETPVKLTDCTYNRTSQLTLTMVKEYNDFVVRCTVHQDLFSEEGNGIAETQPITVHYEPSVDPISTVPEQPPYEVGTDLTLVCSGDANPNPTFYWVLPDDTQQDVERLKLSNLELGMGGEYTCVVSNEFGGQKYPVNRTITISVVETTTTSTTTPSSTTVPEVTGAPVGPPEDDSNTTTIIIIVVCIVVVIIIIVIAVVIYIIKKKQKRPEIEEPPEKPRNNQDLSFYGNRPDLVSTDMKNSGHTLNASFNNSFDSSESKPRNEELMYVDLAFDDKPRSRRPIQLLDNTSMGSSTPYADIAMPRV